MLGKFHGQRSLEGSGPWDGTEPDMTEKLSAHTTRKGSCGIHPVAKTTWPFLPTVVTFWVSPPSEIESNG